MIELDRVSVDRGRRRVLYEVDLQIRPGELVALLGPNGAGKSTCLGAASGDLDPAEGEVRLDARPLSDLGLAERAARRAVLPQASSLSFALPVEDVVLLGRTARAGGATTPDDLRIAHAALHEVGLLDLAARAYTTLSGGERQRVHLARVLAQLWDRPDGVLLLDEPTSALDLKHQHDVLARVRQRTRGGAAALAVLHDLGLAALYADRAVLLSGGRVAAEGPPREVLEPDTVAAVYGVRTERVDLGGGRFALVPLGAHAPEEGSLGRRA